MNDMIWMVVAAAAGMSIGAAAAWRLLGRRAQVREARLTASAQEQIAATTRDLRALNTRLQIDLETAQKSLQHRAAAAAAEHRNAVARLEERLRFAYREIDRLNASAGGKAAEEAGSLAAPDPSGFALTQPFVR